MSRPAFPNLRRRTPTVLQMDAMECGAAALGMVLAFHGCHVPLHILRQKCGVSRDGSKASHLLKAAREFGLIARGWKGPADQIGADLLPAILFWNFDHFVVLEGFGQEGRAFYINDPATGRRCVSETEFSASFSGVILSFTPGPDFKARSRPAGATTYWRELLAEAPALWVFVLGCTALLAWPGIAAAVLVRAFFDDYYIGGEDHWLGPILIGLALAAGLQVVLTAWQRNALLRWRLWQDRRETTHFFERILHLPMSWFSGRGTGEIAHRFSLQEEVASLIGSKIVPTLLAAIPMAALSLTLFLFDTELAVFACAGIVAIFVSLAILRQRRYEAGRQQAYLAAQHYETALQGMTPLENLKSGVPTGFLQKLEKIRSRLHQERQTLEASSQIAGVIPSLMSGLVFAGSLLWGSVQIIEGRLTVGTLVAFQMLWLQLTLLLQGWLKLPEYLEELATNRRRIEDVLVAETECPPTSSAEKFSGLEVRNLSFGYSLHAKPVLHDVSFSISAGQWIALVGASGSGKSTLVKLLTGLFEPWSGEVLLNGRKCIPEAVASCAAVVEQDIIFFQGTLRENLLLGENTSEEALEKTLSALGIPHLLASPDGTIVQEDGTNFSVGQLQNLEIARALARRPGLVILDEASSSLDLLQIALLKTELRRIGCAVFVVSHQPEIIREADAVLVLDEGNIVARGTFEQLSGSSVLFRELIGL